MCVTCNANLLISTPFPKPQPQNKFHQNPISDLYFLQINHKFAFIKLKCNKMKTLVPQFMTFNEMQAKFPDSWVLVANPESEPAKYEIKGGFFLYKNKLKSKVIEKSKELNAIENFVINLITVRYTGEIKLPENHIICL